MRANYSKRTGRYRSHPCLTCGAGVFKASNKWCRTCTRNHNKRKRREEQGFAAYEQRRVVYRKHVTWDMAGPDQTPAPAYKPGVVSFWQRWYENPDNLCDEDALRRWEDSLGLSHDVPIDWDTTFGLGRTPQYPRRNTVQ